MVWYGMAWQYGMVWYGMVVWYGMECFWNIWWSGCRSETVKLVLGVPFTFCLGTCVRHSATNQEGHQSLSSGSFLFSHFQCSQDDDFQRVTIQQSISADTAKGVHFSDGRPPYLACDNIDTFSNPICIYIQRYAIPLMRSMAIQHCTRVPSNHYYQGLAIPPVSSAADEEIYIFISSKLSGNGPGHYLQHARSSHGRHLKLRTFPFKILFIITH